MPFIDSRRFRVGFSGLAIFTLLAGDFWRNLFGWWAFGAIAAAIAATAVTIIIRSRHRLAFHRLPLGLILFLALAIASISWSYYPVLTAAASLVQVLTTATAVSVVILLNWAELLIVLASVLRLILLMSFAFEFIVAAILRRPVLPVWIVPADPNHFPKELYWSRGLLFDSGKIQGILGNSSLLAMVALISVIVFFIQLASRSVGRFWGSFWLLVAFFTLFLTRSATIFVDLVVVMIVGLMAILVRRTAGRVRALSYGAIVLVLAVLATVGFFLRNPVLHLLGKSADLTGRIGIWEGVIEVAAQRPAFGWGWISYWDPAIEPFKHIAVRNGLVVMHAHDAWLDVWLQLGIVGLVLFALIALPTLVRSWHLVTDRSAPEFGRPKSIQWLAMLPLLVFTAQLVQSITESRMLLEGGWMLLTVWAVKTTLDPLDANTPVEHSRAR